MRTELRGVPAARATPWRLAKETTKRLLAYQPLVATESVRRCLSETHEDAAPYCPPAEGDLLYTLVTAHRLARCLQVGFATGSTALYMLAGAVPLGGEVVSIDLPAARFNALGLDNVERAGFASSHRLIEENSALALPQLHAAGACFDLVVADGWKTFDHLAMEAYFLSRMLRTAGFLVFDDTKMPSVDRVVRMLGSHYGYEEIDYRAHGQPWGPGLLHILTQKTLRRPYRAFRKTASESDLPISVDWAFWERF
jgi:predicted O-methyltransferase YrrM